MLKIGGSASNYFTIGIYSDSAQKSEIELHINLWKLDDFDAVDLGIKFKRSEIESIRNIHVAFSPSNCMVALKQDEIDDLNAIMQKSDDVVHAVFNEVVDTTTIENTCKRIRSELLINCLNQML